MIIKTMSEIKNTTAQMMVILSRFFSMMLVPVWVEYIELAIASDIPVPLPECMRMNMMSPIPDKNSKTKNMITKGVKISRFFQRWFQNQHSKS